MMTAIGRFRFLDLLPQARVTLMEHTSEGVLVLDATDRIVDINGAARRLFGIEAAVIGRSFHDGIPALRAGVNWTMGTPPQIVPLSVEPDMTLEVSISPVRQPRGQAHREDPPHPRHIRAPPRGDGKGKAHRGSCRMPWET